MLVARNDPVGLLSGALDFRKAWFVVGSHVADMAFKPADMSPTSAILGLCLEHDGFLLAFLALMDCENEDQVD
jgi:hypothetical protein